MMARFKTMDIFFWGVAFDNSSYYEDAELKHETMLCGQKPLTCILVVFTTK